MRLERKKKSHTVANKGEVRVWQMSTRGKLYTAHLKANWPGDSLFLALHPSSSSDCPLLSLVFITQFALLPSFLLPYPSLPPAPFKATLSRVRPMSDDPSEQSQGESLLMPRSKVSMDRPRCRPQMSSQPQRNAL